MLMFMHNTGINYGNCSYIAVIAKPGRQHLDSEDSHKKPEVMVIIYSAKKKNVAHCLLYEIHIAKDLSVLVIGGSVLKFLLVYARINQFTCLQLLDVEFWAVERVGSKF